MAKRKDKNGDFISGFASDGIHRFSHLGLTDKGKRVLPNGNFIDSYGFEHYSGKPDLPTPLKHWKDK